MELAAAAKCGSGSALADPSTMAGAGAAPGSSFDYEQASVDASACTCCLLCTVHAAMLWCAFASSTRVFLLVTWFC